MTVSVLKVDLKKKNHGRRFNRTIQNKMQNFKESIGSPTGSNEISPLTPWCTQLANNEPTRHMCRAEIRQLAKACAVGKNAKGTRLSKCPERIAIPSAIFALTYERRRASILTIANPGKGAIHKVSYYRVLHTEAQWYRG